MCKISVVVPVYNASKYIKRNVKSILKQTFQDFELLLIDDGSSDESGTICDKLSETDCRIKVFHTENKGVSCARNLGINQSTGKYICFIDADDIVHRDYLEKLYNSIVDSDCDLVVCNFYKVYNDGHRVVGLKNDSSCDTVFNIICNDILIVVWNKLFERKKIKHLFDEKLEFNQDTVFCLQYYMDNDARIKMVDEPLYEYVIHGTGLTGIYNQSTMNGIEKIFSYSIQLSKNIEDTYLRKRAIYHLCRSYYYSIYTFIFENLAKKEANGQTFEIIENIISNKRYRRVVRYILWFSIFEFKVCWDRYKFNGLRFCEHMYKRSVVISKREIAYYIASMLNSKRLVYLIARCKIRTVKNKKQK